MNLDILEEDKYISANLASQKIGYSSDYIGQLCRGGKILGKLSGRTWYVDLNSLIKHRQNRQLGRRKTTETNPKSLKRNTLFYEVDKRPLFPTLRKAHPSEFPLRKMSFSKRILTLAFSIIIILGVGSLFGYESNFSLPYSQDLSASINFFAEEQTGAAASEFLALIGQSISEFGDFSRAYISGLLIKIIDSVNYFEAF